MLFSGIKTIADYERPILAAEVKFFGECNTGNGRVLYSMSLLMSYSDMLVGSACDCCSNKES